MKLNNIKIGRRLGGAFGLLLLLLVAVTLLGMVCARFRDVSQVVASLMQGTAISMRPPSARMARRTLKR